MEQNNAYIKGFIPYALAAFLIGIVGGFSTVLGPAFVQDLGISYNNTTWTSLAQAMSTAAIAPVILAYSYFQICVVMFALRQAPAGAVHASNRA